MNKNLKNEILGKQSFSKVKNNIVNCIVNTTIHALRGGGKNLGGKSLIRANINLKTILFGLILSLLVMQCSKSSDPVVNPVTVNDTCPSGQSKNASGTCVVDATLCQNGQGKAGACTTCNAGYTVSNGICIVQNNLVLSVSSLTIYAQNGYSTNFTITTDQNWTITAPAWLSVSPTSGGPGSAIQVNLTTTTLNTTAGITGNLSVNATGKAELNKTLNLTRTYYTNCGGTLGLSGPSIVVAKWVSVGAGDHSAYSPTDPNGRFLVAVAKGCGGPDNVNENLFKNTNLVGLGFLKNARATIFSSTVYFNNSPLAGLSSVPSEQESLLGVAYYYILFKNYEVNGAQRLDTIYNDSSIPISQINTCNAKNQYLLRNISEILSSTINAQSCITDTQFPPELKDTMNDLLRGASKPYTIQ